MVNITPDEFHDLEREPPLRLVAISPVVLHAITGAELAHDIIVTVRSELDSAHPGPPVNLLLRSDRAQLEALRAALDDALRHVT